MESEELTAEAMIEKAIIQVRDRPTTRASAIAITKLEEAQMWLTQQRKELNEAVKKAGYIPQGT